MDVRKEMNSATSYADVLPFRQSLLRRGNTATLLAAACSLNKKANTFTKWEKTEQSGTKQINSQCRHNNIGELNCFRVLQSGSSKKRTNNLQFQSMAQTQKSLPLFSVSTWHSTDVLIAALSLRLANNLFLQSHFKIGPEFLFLLPATKVKVGNHEFARILVCFCVCDC